MIKINLMIAVEFNLSNEISGRYSVFYYGFLY